MVTSVNAVDSTAYAYYPEKVRKVKTEEVREPINFQKREEVKEDSTNVQNRGATPEEVDQVEDAQKDYEKDKRNIMQKFADKMKKIFSKPDDAAAAAGLGAVAGGLAGGLTSGLLSKGAISKIIKFGGLGALVGLALVGLGFLTGKLFGKDEEKVPEEGKEEQPTEPEVKEPRIYTVKKGDNIWNIAKADLIEANKDNPDYKITNAEILRRTKEIMDINGLKFEKDGYHVMIRPGDKLKLDPEEAKKEELKELAVA